MPRQGLVPKPGLAPKPGLRLGLVPKPGLASELGPAPEPGLGLRARVPGLVEGGNNDDEDEGMKMSTTYP